MDITQAITEACKKPTLAEALAWLAIWETERAVKQALEWQRTGVSTAANGGGWDTAFEYIFNELLKQYPVYVVSKVHVPLPQSRITCRNI